MLRMLSMLRHVQSAETEVEYAEVVGRLNHQLARQAIHDKSEGDQRSFLLVLLALLAGARSVVTEASEMQAPGLQIVLAGVVGWASFELARESLINVAPGSGEGNLERRSDWCAAREMGGWDGGYQCACRRREELQVECVSNGTVPQVM